jgi:amidase
VTFPTALAIAARLRRREVSSVELVTAALAAIERDGLGAFVAVDRRGALREARRADARLARGDDRAPFLGVPTGIKDHEPVRGLPTRLGSRAFAWLRSPIDGHVARACRRAGFVVLGKTATSELTILPFVHTRLHPPARNPHDRDRYSGGSSGGAAAAVAAGIVPIAPGSDGGGSIRIPAAFCGLVGFKPGRDVLVDPYGRLDPIGLSSLGPLARDVRDAAALLDALAVHPDGSFARACDDAVPPLRVKLLVRPILAGLAVEPEIAAAATRTVELLARAGHRASDAAPIDGELDEFLPVMARMVSRVPLLPGMARLLEPTTRWLHARGKRVTAEDARACADRIAARVHAWFGDADLVVTPTVAVHPPRVGAFDGMDGEAAWRASAALGAFTAPFNVSGQPAVSLPLARAANGLPIGVQIVARRGADRVLIAAARQIEREQKG